MFILVYNKNYIIYVFRVCFFLIRIGVILLVRG